MTLEISARLSDGRVPQSVTEARERRVQNEQVAALNLRCVGKQILTSHTHTTKYVCDVLSSKRRANRHADE